MIKSRIDEVIMAVVGIGSLVLLVVIVISFELLTNI